MKNPLVLFVGAAVVAVERDETSGADLAVLCAILSSLRDRPLPRDLRDDPFAPRKNNSKSNRI